ncbi:MAG: reprolysin-like metallopeptidase, partial [Ferruginibacter sp.]
MKFFFQRIVLLFIFSLAAFYGNAQNAFFTDATENSFKDPTQKRVIIPSRYRTLQLNKSGLLNFLNTIPSEKNLVGRNISPVIEIPMPGGGTAKFNIWESSVMEPRLAAKFPGIKTFTGQGIDDPTANIKLDFTQFGFHAMIISSLRGAVFIDPYARENTINYISYNKTDFKKSDPFFELPPIKNLNVAGSILSADKALAVACGGAQLRTYRLALAATAEYTMIQGGTVAAAQAAEVTTMNRVNGVYEREVAIRMVLVADNDLLIYTDAATDPYTNDDGSTMLDENQSNITAIIGNGNFDIGHVFSTGGGGVAGLGVVCVTGQKANGVTGSGSPVGDPFDIDYVAHEMGHQFGGNHTFNSNSGNCGGGNGESTTNAEPGSGSTIMAYAGICGSDDLQPHSDAQFHAISYNEITSYITSGSGNNCAVITSTGNTPPVVNAGPDFIIPKSTPFSLT